MLVQRALLRSKNPGEDVVGPRMNRLFGDISVEYDDVGSGEPVVFVHGLAEDRLSWKYQMDRLGEGRRLVCYDLRGHGRTTLGDGQGTPDQLAADLVCVLETLTGPATCVGFSLGGTVVLQAAAEHPKLVRHAIVLGTSSVVGKMAADFYAQRIALVQSGSVAQIAEALREDTRAAIASTAVDIDALTAYRLEAIGDGAGYVNAASAMRRVHEHPLTRALPAVRCHVDIVGAAQDSFCPRKATDILLAGLGDAMFHEIIGAGHLMNVDRPDAVTELLGQLLRGR